MAVLALTTRLTGILGLLIDLLLDGLFIGDLRCTDICLNLKLPQQTVNNDFQMELAHTGNNRLARLLIGVGLKRGIFLGKLRQSKAHLLLTGLRLWLDGHTNDRLREFHRLENNGMIGIAQRVTGRGILQANRCGDIAGVDALQILTVIGMHLQNAAHTLTSVLIGVHDGLAGLECTGIHTEECQLTDIRVGRDLERQRSKRRVVVCKTGFFLIRLGVNACDRFFVQR